ncbi:MAG: N,N'-diacetyllegionaminate synthase [Arenicella sp.]|jgi:N,N'-diacetyllegionaminate synthase
MQRTLIIAEAGVNHNGDINLAKKLIDVAVQAGVDYVKFQTFKAENLVSKSAIKADYQKTNTSENDSAYSMLKQLELSENDHEVLIKYCEEKGIKFLSTAFDFDSLEYIKDKIDFFKIPSGEITNLPYLERVAKLNLPIIMSTGMCTMKEVENSFQVLIDKGVNKNDITILHCNTEYPTPMEDVNLNAMLTIGKTLDVDYGYSDHTLGIEIPTAAVAMGAKVIEKHFTLDNTMPGPDHKASLEPNELIKMVQQIRNIEKALGSFEKAPSASEQKNISVARKSLVALQAIKKGDLLTTENISTKRPGNGVSPMKWNEAIGSAAIRDFENDELIEL